MKTRIIRIGNSRGIRIPKAALEQTNLHDEVELEVQADQIVIRGATHPRQGWESRFLEMARQGDDALLDEHLPSSSWEEREWQW
jgi:antitoxin MazE